MNTNDIFDKASLLWEKGNTKEAFALFRKAANLADDGAQLNLGTFYAHGIGTRKDIEKALYWYKKAWRSGGQTSACMNIAQVYASIGNNRRAVFWWKRAVNENDGDAALELAQFYLTGAIKKDKKTIIALLNKVGRTTHVTEDGKEEALRILRKLSKEKRK